MTYVPPKVEAVSYPPPAGLMAARSLSGITDLILHHTAGPAAQSPLEIDAEHRAQGWSGIGYNYVIGHDGTIWRGRPDMYVPAAAYGRNAESINVVLTGNFMVDEPAPAQLAAVQALALYLHLQYHTIVRTIGHRDVATLFYPNDLADYATLCPGDKLYAHLPDIKALVLAGIPKT